MVSPDPSLSPLLLNRNPLNLLQHGLDLFVQQPDHSRASHPISLASLLDILLTRQSKWLRMAVKVYLHLGKFWSSIFVAMQTRETILPLKIGEEGCQVSGKNCTNWSILCQELAKQVYLHLERFCTRVNLSTWLLAFVFTILYCFPLGLKVHHSKMLNLSWELVSKAYLHQESFRAQFQLDVQVYSCKLPKYLDAYQTKTRQTAHMGDL